MFLFVRLLFLKNQRWSLYNGDEWASWSRKKHIIMRGRVNLLFCPTWHFFFKPHTSTQQTQEKPSRETRAAGHQINLGDIEDVCPRNLIVNQYFSKKDNQSPSLSQHRTSTSTWCFPFMDNLSGSFGTLTSNLNSRPNLWPDPNSKPQLQTELPSKHWRHWIHQNNENNQFRLGQEIIGKSGRKVQLRKLNSVNQNVLSWGELVNN